MHTTTMEEYFDNDLEENDFTSDTDPEGSYTGNPTITEMPEQDADDL